MNKLVGGKDQEGRRSPHCKVSDFADTSLGMFKRMKISWVSLCAGWALLSGCCSDRSAVECSFQYDPTNPDKLAPTLALDPLFPPAPMPTDYDRSAANRPE